MKKLLACITVLIVVACYLWSCEKDDICATGTPTTPNMVVTFFNMDNHTIPKPVTDLEFYIDGHTDTIKVGTLDSINVPLRVDTTATRWAFKYNLIQNGDTLPKLNYVTFNYTTSQEYISRACGYKTTFKLNPNTADAPNPLIEFGPDSWMSSAQIIDANITNTDTTHVKIYF